jgi:hypothetical protein
MGVYWADRSKAASPLSTSYDVEAAASRGLDPTGE